MGFHACTVDYLKSLILEGDSCQSLNDKEYSRIKRNGLFGLVCLRMATLFTPMYIEYPTWKKEKLKEEKPFMPDLLIDGRFLRYHLPFNHKRPELPCPFRAYLIILFLIYALIKSIVMYVVFLNLEKAAKAWNPCLDSLEFGLNYTTNCILLDQLGEIDRLQARKLEYWANFLRGMGSPVNTINEILPFGLNMFGLLIFVVLSFAYVNANNPAFKLNSLTLYEDPVIEQRRLRALFVKIFNDLSRAIEKRDLWHMKMAMSIVNCEQPFQEIELSPHKSHEIPSFPMDIFEFPFEHKWKLFDYDNNYEDKVVEDLCFNRIEYKMVPKIEDLLVDRSDSMLILPAHLTLKSYKRLVNIFRLSVGICLLVGLLVAWIGVIGMVCREINQRAETRILEIECKQWNESAVPRRWPSKLEHSTSRLYEQETGNVLSIDQLAMEVELPLLGTKPTFQFLVELVLSYTIMGLWCGAGLVFVMLNHTCQTIWLKQIGTQIRMISHSIDEMIQSNGPKDSVGTQVFIDKHKKHQIEENLALTYTNFVLFRRELPHNVAVYSYALIQLTLIVMGGALSGFMCLSSGRNRLLVWTVTIITVIVLDFIAYLSVSTTTQVHHLFKYCNSLMAKASQLGMEHSYMFELWRRQILSSVDVELTFGTRILGFELTRSNLVQFNSYVLGATLYLYRSTMI